MTVMILLVSNPNMWDKVEELTPAFFGGFCLDVRFFLAPCQHLQLAYVAEMGAYKALKFLPTQPTHMRFCAGFAEPSCRRNEDVKPTFQEIPTPHTACIQFLEAGKSAQRNNVRQGGITHSNLLYIQ